MAKSSTVYICNTCGFNSIKWQGKCPSCGEWNSFIEEVSTDKSVKTTRRTKPLQSLEDFGELAVNPVKRIALPEDEFNRVTGGGIVPGSIILLGGEPGIGKSTLLLQVALRLKHIKSLYISGEESNDQIKLRAKRLNLTNSSCLLLPETNLETVLSAIEQLNPELVIIDSIQTLNSEDIDNTPGSISQIRHCAAKLTELAKRKNISIILVGHITKEGYLAGPKLLEHMVDTVLYFEGDRNYDYRILRTMKNRFGSVSDIGIYEMNESGLAEIKNPSEILLSHRENDLSGITISAMLEGNRPILIELQALVTPTHFGTPQRNSTGFDSRRLSMILAVLEKRCGLRMNIQDVFLNVAGGLKVSDTSTDLGAAVAIASSLKDNPVSRNYCFAGELGLSGEIRPVRHLEKRISEAEKLGFTRIFVSPFNKNIKSMKFTNIQISCINSLSQLLSELFG